jgi:hypothetical protein
MKEEEEPQYLTMEWHQTLEEVFPQPNSETPLKTAISLRLDGKNHYASFSSHIYFLI